MSNTPTIDPDDFSDDGTFRVKCHPETAASDFDTSAIDPDVGDTVRCEYRVTLNFVIPVDLKVTDKGDTWNDGKEQYAYGKIDWTPAIELFRDEVGGTLPEGAEGQVRDRLSGNRERGVPQSAIDQIVEALQ